MTKKSEILFFILFSWLMITPLFSQTETDWMKHKKRIILDKVMNMEYTHPAGFIGDSTLIGLDRVCTEANLVSQDRSFMVFYRINNPFTKDDSIKFTPDYPEYDGNSNHQVDAEHISIIKSFVDISFGKAADWKDYVHYYPQQYAKNKFNADTVISVTLPLEIHDDFSYAKDYYYYGTINRRFHSNYTHGVVLIIQKKGRGFVAMYCFYDENAINNLDAYMAAVEGSLRYRDDEPELKKYFEDEDIVFVCPGIPRQRRSPLTGNE